MTWRDDLPLNFPFALESLVDLARNLVALIAKMNGSFMVFGTEVIKKSKTVFGLKSLSI